MFHKVKHRPDKQKGLRSACSAFIGHCKACPLALWFPFRESCPGGAASRIQSQLDEFAYERPAQWGHSPEPSC